MDQVAGRDGGEADADNEIARPSSLLIRADCHTVGQSLVIGLPRLVFKLGTVTKMKIVEIMMTYRSVLLADTNGSVVMKTPKD